LHCLRTSHETLAIGAACLLLAASVALGKDVADPAAYGPDAPSPTVTARSAILIEGATGDTLFAKDADARRYPASLTKVLTAIVVLRTDGASELARVGNAPANLDGARVGLEPGQWATVSDLLSGMLVRSGNDAALALAEHIGGSVEGFAGMMNDTARALGATNSHFANPHGLHDPDHYTTARDLARIMRHGMQWQEIRQLVAQHSAVIASTEDAAGTTVVSRNTLLDRYEGANGIKTGYTRAAGRCLAASAQRDGRELIAIVLYSEKLWQDAETLLDWGFDNFETVELARKAKTWWRVPVRGGRSAELRAVTTEDVVVVVPKGRRDACVLEPVLHEVRAPVARGQELGQLRVSLPNGSARTVSLVSAERIELSLWATVAARLGGARGLAAVAFGLMGVTCYAAAAKSARRRRRRLAAEVRGADRRRAR
jgi:D-alanyl-D-alanine carboxypeptidase (penicillin-binding protein 5/6)